MSPSLRLVSALSALSILLVSCSAAKEPHTSTTSSSAAIPASVTMTLTGTEADSARTADIIAGKRMIEDAFDAAYGAHDLSELLEARAWFTRMLEVRPDDPLLQYYVSYCDYHATLALRISDPDRSQTFLDEAVDGFERVTELDESFAEGWAILSACYGLKAAGGAFSGMKYGPKSAKAITRAARMAPRNPRVLLMLGISKFYTPESFGGNKTEALQLFRETAAIFDSITPTPTAQPDWGHVETYTYIGLSLMESGDKTGARTAFQRVLEIDPEYGWVKYELLPKLEQEMKGE